MAEKQVTGLPLRVFADHVGTRPHAMAGAVIAATGAQAAALGAACMAISREQFELPATAFAAEWQQMIQIQNEMLEWCDEDATAIARFVALREAGETLRGQTLLCNAPATVGELAVGAATVLQEFRPHVHERVRDDLEMSISLLAATARAALLLLDSNLRIWPERPLRAQFAPRQDQLAAAIARLTPRDRILDENE